MGQSAQLCCPQKFVDHPLTNVLEFALPKANILIDRLNETPQINRLVFKQITYPLELQHCTIWYCPQAGEEKNYIPQLAHKQRLIVEQKDSERGVIVFKNGYYVGALANKAANGEGTIYLIQSAKEKHEREIITFIIKGSWKDDLLCEGNIQNHKGQNLFYIKWAQISQTIVVRFEKGEIKEYRGQANFNSQTLPQILTGKIATIVFRNGAVYNGPVSNGLMDTGQQNGQFITADRRQKYFGKYVNGLRHGSSTMEVRKQGENVKFKLMWEQGVPQYDTLELIDPSFIEGRSFNYSLVSNRTRENPQSHF